MAADPSIDAAEAVALFRYKLIAEAASPRLGPAERGKLVRELASQPIELPDRRLHQFARGTFDRWLRAYREQGLAGLKPEPRADLGLARRHPELLEEACQLRIELPARSAAQISAILLARHGIRVAERAVREHLQHGGLHRAALAQQPHVFGRFEASRPNELWVGSYVPYPRTASSRRSFLFLLVDHFSRLIVHGRWMTEQNARAGQQVLRAPIQRRGVPEILYTDYADLRIMPTLVGAHDRAGPKLSA
jgi:putative transposase